MRRRMDLCGMLCKCARWGYIGSSDGVLAVGCGGVLAVGCVGGVPAVGCVGGVPPLAIQYTKTIHTK